MRIAAGANVELSRETIAVYASELATLTPEQLERAAGRTIREWDKGSIMPPPSFILARAGNDGKLLAEQAWELAWKLVKRDWYADGIGWVAGSKEQLTPAMQYAIRQCGGEYRMAYGSDEESFPFIRRDFLAAHERFTAEDGEQVRLTQGAAVKLLTELGNRSFTRHGSGFFQLAPVEPANEPPPTPAKQLTAEEHEARIAELKRQAETLLDAEVQS